MAQTSMTAATSTGHTTRSNSSIVTTQPSHTHVSCNSNNTPAATADATAAAAAALPRVTYLTPFALHGRECVEHGRVYRLADKRDCFAFRCFADAMDGFVLRYNKPGDMLVWEKKLPGEAMHVIKAFVVLSNSASAHGAVTPRLIYDMLHDAVFRETWDPYRIAAFCVARLDARNDIGYYAARSPAPLLVDGRDFVNQRMWHDAGRGEYVIFNTSVPHDAVPSKHERKKGKQAADATSNGASNGSHNSSKHHHHNSNISSNNNNNNSSSSSSKASSLPSECSSCVRALSKLTGYFIRPWYDPATGQLDGASLTYIAQSDLCGWIPASITNYIASKYAPKTVETMRRALRTFEVWLPEQLATGGYVRDWDTTPEWWCEDGDEDEDEDGGGSDGKHTDTHTRTKPTPSAALPPPPQRPRSSHGVANETVDEALRLWGMTTKETTAATTTAATTAAAHRTHTA